MIALAALGDRQNPRYGRSGTPVAEETKSVPVTLTQDQANWIASRASEFNVSRSAIIRELIAWCIKESGVV